ncbi:hypothetical protein IscW_ISCW018446, partial [Ixodes scapularis]
MRDRRRRLVGYALRSTATTGGGRPEVAQGKEIGLSDERLFWADYERRPRPPTAIRATDAWAKVQRIPDTRASGPRPRPGRIR